MGTRPDGATCPSSCLLVLTTVCLLWSLATGCILPLVTTTTTTSNEGRAARDINSNCGPNDTAPPNRVNTTERLVLLRAELEREELAAFIILLDEEARLEWISGFSGSNGMAVVTQREARLWTDGRYFLQAGDQLDCNWFLMKMGEPGVPELPEWILQTLGSSQQNRSSASADPQLVGADPQLVGAEDWLGWNTTFRQDNITLQEIDNLIDRIWTEAGGRPPQVYKDIVVHDLRWAGETWQNKVGRLREKLSELKVSGMVITELDEIAWLFNIRGEGKSNFANLFHSPLVESLALITHSDIIIWLRLDKVTPEVERHLVSPDCNKNRTCVRIGEVETGLAELAAWMEEQAELGGVLVTRPSTYLAGASYAVYSAVPADNRKLLDSPILLMKSIKNQVEVEGMMNAHIKDAVALCDWAARMEYEIQEVGSNWTEISAAALLEEYRMEQQDSRGLSFTTIAAYGANGAIIHYMPAPETNAVLGRDSLFMVDSGGQYLDGTTDVTRTFHFGTPTQEQVERYTDVLMGAVELARVVVPEDTLDTAIDLATRQFLFRNGLNYRHGTGHGIGAYLKVHEGPIRVAMSGSSQAKLKPDMFFSDEPGYYQDGEFGIRLETILRIVASNLSASSAYGKFIQFEPVTLVPFEPKLINVSRMSREQVDWINEYNTIVLDKVGARLAAAGKERALRWLEQRTGTLLEK